MSNVIIGFEFAIGVILAGVASSLVVFVVMVLRELISCLSKAERARAHEIKRRRIADSIAADAIKARKAGKTLRQIAQLGIDANAVLKPARRNAAKA